MSLPYLGNSSRPPSFVFVVHPRDEEDILHATCLSLLREMSASHEDFLARALKIPPTILGEILFGFSPFRGELITIACLPRDVPSARGRREIARAAHVAVDRGAAVIGLGALTAPATGGGARLVEELPSGVTVTNGNAYTAAVLRANVVEARDALALDGPVRVAVVGCTGSVGTAVSRLLSEAGFDLVLIGRRVAKVERLLGDLLPAAWASEDVADVALAQIVLVLTSAPSARLQLGALRAGTVVIDAAEPPNVHPNDVRAWAGHVTVTRGGRVLVPEYHCTYDFRLVRPNETFACLAETYVFAREGIREHSVGAPDPRRCERLERVAFRHGLRPSPLFPSSAGDASAVPLSSSLLDTNAAPALEGRSHELVHPR